MLPVSDMKESGTYAFTGTHRESEATIVYQCSKDTKVVTSIMIYIPVQSDSQGVGLVDAEVHAVQTSGYRVCFDVREHRTFPQMIERRVVNMRRGEIMAYTIGLGPAILGNTELEVNIQIGRPSSFELTGGDTPKCGA